MFAPKIFQHFNVFAVAALMFAAVSVLGARPAAACSCMETTVESSYNNSDAVIVARPVARINVGSQTWYVAHVRKVYKGCSDEPLVILTTANNSAACGMQLNLGNNYLINASPTGNLLRIPRLSFSLCDYNRRVAELSDADKAFLDGRTVCCGDECECADGSQPVNCFANPCDVAAECPDGQCVANYCGGCHAEFYDAAGYAVCQDDSQCATDADCSDGEWCRQAAPPENDLEAPPSYECVPLVGPGESCNGFTLPWYYEQCAEGLVCDTPDFIADAPGVCRAPCADNLDCADGEYCANDAVCDTDGACELSIDCNLDGNDYPHIECVGHGVCDPTTSACGWECESPDCVDLLGVDFGPCDAVLGFAVVGGSCAQVSGCDAAGFTLFASQEECEAACGSSGQCASDADCVETGCSGQLCAAEHRVTTCEWRPEYACYNEPTTTCGCTDGVCGWARTPELAECLDNTL